MATVTPARAEPRTSIWIAGPRGERKCLLGANHSWNRPPTLAITAPPT
jgi:hypothetical protein